MSHSTVHEALAAHQDDPIWAIRGHAIHSHAALEQALCFLFGAISNTAVDIAAVIYFQIVSAPARIRIIQDLIEKKHGATYEKFWKGFFNKLESVNKTRNKIAHWNAVITVNKLPDLKFESETKLVSPDFLNLSKLKPLTASEIKEFMELCLLLRHACNMFVMSTSNIMGGSLEPAIAKQWIDLFVKPIDLAAIRALLP